MLEIALDGDRGIAHYKKDNYDNVIDPNSRLLRVDKAGMLVTAIKKKVILNPDNCNLSAVFPGLFHSSH